MSNLTLVVLLVAFQLKHFIADYPLQGRYMLGKFKDDWGFLLPLLSHAAVHAVFTFLLTCYFGWIQALCLALFDATIHFMMDRIKASKKYLGRYKNLTAETYLTATDDQKKSNTYFYWSLGFDQMIHHLTDLTIVVFLFLK